MKWIKNLESIAITKTSGKCPYCGSDNTDYTFVGNVGGVGYGEIWCNDCQSAYQEYWLRKSIIWIKKFLKISYIDKYTIKKNNRSPHRAGFAIKTPLSKGSSKISISNLL